jgi:hypothetical protein
VAAVKNDFQVNVLFWGNVDAGTALIDRHSDARFIIDHIGIQQPSVPPAPPQPWADLPKVVELAKRKNAVIKITGACTLSKEPYPFPDIWDPLARIFDAWGFERCLWGTDWTRAFAVVSYEQAVKPFLETEPQRHRAGNADGRRLRQSVWLVTEESLMPDPFVLGVSGKRHPLSPAAQKPQRATAFSRCPDVLGAIGVMLPSEGLEQFFTRPCVPSC